jgi:hypothetical protein
VCVCERERERGERETERERQREREEEEEEGGEEVLKERGEGKTEMRTMRKKRQSKKTPEAELSGFTHWCLVPSARGIGVIYEFPHLPLEAQKEGREIIHRSCPASLVYELQKWQQRIE